MQGIIVRTLIIAAGIAAAAWLIPGIAVDGPGTLILAAILLGLVNAFVRPLIVLLTLPLTLLTLGRVLIVVNALMFGLVAWMLDGFTVASSTAAVLGWRVLVVVSWLAGSFIGPKGRYEVIIIDRRRR
jgi:putative membrane protein